MHRSKASSFDHLVGAGEQRGWRVEAKRLRRLEVDSQFELGRLHDRQVGWLFTFENPRVGARPPIGIRNTGSVTHQSASHDVLTKTVARRTACCADSATGRAR